jgi:hypothetical protein
VADCGRRGLDWKRYPIRRPTYRSSSEVSSINPAGERQGVPLQTRSQVASVSGETLPSQTSAWQPPLFPGHHSSSDTAAEALHGSMHEPYGPLPALPSTRDTPSGHAYAPVSLRSLPSQSAASRTSESENVDYLGSAPSQPPTFELAEPSAAQQTIQALQGDSGFHGMGASTTSDATVSASNASQSVRRPLSPPLLPPDLPPELSPPALTRPSTDWASQPTSPNPGQ